MSLGLLASTLAAFSASGAMLFVSRLNYPGGEALSRLHELAEGESGVVRVHMDTLSCMTGITRFLEKRPPPVSADGNWEHGEALWVYDKTENQTTLLDPLFWEGVNYALTEEPKRVPGRWEIIATVNAFAGVGLLRPDEGFSWRDLDFEAVRTLVELEGKGWVQKFRDVWHHGWTTKDYDWVRASFSRIGDICQGIMRKYVTKGWWVQVNMEPQICILKKEEKSMLDAIGNERDANDNTPKLAREGEPVDSKGTPGSASSAGQVHGEF